MNELKIALLGAPEVRLDGQRVQFSTRKALTLLAYLVTEPGAKARSTLARLFWPDSDDERAHASFRRTLARLKDAIGETYLQVDRDVLQFMPRNAADVDLYDVAAAWEIARSGRSLESSDLDVMHVALGTNRGRFLDGISLDDAPDLDDWISGQRERWHRRLSVVMQCRSQIHLERGELETAIDSTLRWAAHDRYDEAAHYRLMQLYLAAGDRAAALQSYELYRRDLANALDATPGHEIVVLAQRARAESSLGESATHRRARQEWESFIAPMPLVGRSDAHRQLSAALRAVERGGFVVVTVEGEAGIGKSRVVDDFLRLSATRADVASGRAFEAGGSVPYQPIVEGFRGRLSREKNPANLLSLNWLAELTRILPELAERVQGLRRPNARSLPEDSIRLFEAVARLGVELAASRPFVLAIDDLHWADTSTLDLLSYCIRAWGERGSSILLVLTIRTEEIGTGPTLAAWLNSLARERTPTRLTLEPLDLADTKQLVRAARQVDAVDQIDALAERLFRTTRGHPFFLVETLRHLREGGNADELAPGVRVVVRARLDRLPALDRRALSAAAILGDDFSIETLRDVSMSEEAEAVEAVENLTARRLIRGRFNRYQFCHDFVRQVAYDDTSEPRRRMLHCRAVAALDAARAPAAVRLRHARLGGMRTRAFHLALQAGDEAFAALAARGAVEYYELARSLVEDDGSLMARDLEHLYARLGRAYELSDRLADATENYRQLLIRARKLGDQAVECAALNLLGGVSLRSGHDPMAALGYIEEARRVAETIGAGEILAEAHLRLGEAAMYRLDFAATKEHLRVALAAARRMGLKEIVGQTLSASNYPLLQEGRWDEVILQAEEARAIYATGGNRALEADSLAQVAGAHLGAGRVADGIAIARQAGDISREIDNLWGQANAAKELALGLIERGDYDEALSVAIDGLNAARPADFPPLVIMNLINLGTVRRARFDVSAAVEAHQEALALAIGSPAPLIRSMLGESAAGELCADYARLGEWTEAATAARLAMSLRRPGHYQFTLSRPDQTRALVRAGDFNRAVADIASFGQTIGSDRRYRISYLRAAAVLATGDPAMERALLLDARKLAELLSLRGELWQIDLELTRADQRLGEKDRADGYLVSALAILNSLGERLSEQTDRVRFLHGVATALNAARD